MLEWGFQWVFRWNWLNRHPFCVASDTTRGSTETIINKNTTVPEISQQIGLISFRHYNCIWIPSLSCYNNLLLTNFTSSSIVYSMLFTTSSRRLRSPNTRDSILSRWKVRTGRATLRISKIRSRMDSQWSWKNHHPSNFQTYHYRFRIKDFNIFSKSCGITLRFLWYPYKKENFTPFHVAMRDHSIYTNVFTLLRITLRDWGVFINVTLQDPGKTRRLFPCQPEFIGSCDAYKYVISWFWLQGPEVQNSVVWRLLLPDDIIKDLVSEKKPTRNIPIADLELVAHLLHYIMLDFFASIGTL